MRTTTFILVFAAFIMATAFACGRSSTPSSSTGMINRTGSYHFDDIRIEVKIKTGTTIIQFDVAQKSGVNALFSGEAGSNASRWFLYWSPEKELWVYSGDLGVFVWKKDSTGSYQKVIITDDNAADAKMPKPVYELLPDTLRKRWPDLHRNE